MESQKPAMSDQPRNQSHAVQKGKLKLVWLTCDQSEKTEMQLVHVRQSAKGQTSKASQRESKAHKCHRQLQNTIGKSTKFQGKIRKSKGKDQWTFVESIGRQCQVQSLFPIWGQDSESSSKRNKVASRGMSLPTQISPPYNQDTPQGTVLVD